MTLHRTLVTIRCDACPGGRVAVPADVDPAIPGLAVHAMHVHGAFNELASRTASHDSPPQPSPRPALVRTSSHDHSTRPSPLRSCPGPVLTSPRDYPPRPRPSRLGSPRMTPQRSTTPCP